MILLQDKATSAMTEVEFSTYLLQETVGDGPGAWAPVTHIRDLDRVLGYWLQPGLAPTLVVVGIWGANQLMQD